MTKQDFYFQAQVFLQHLYSELDYHKIKLNTHWSIDHLCYRTETFESYEKLREQFKSWGKLLIESDVNGRPIATFKLNEPLVFENRWIDLVELPAPKAGKKTIEGFEHIEVVTDLSMEELKKEFSSQRLDEGGLKKNFNPELEVIFRGCALKFHPLSLESVINVEKNEKLFSAIKSSRVLDLLKPYNPQIVGTYPLDIAVDKSDVDIVAYAHDLGTFFNFMEKNFCHFPHYELRELNIDQQSTVIVNFDFNDVPFEIFAQAIESTQQKAYLHFQVEEKLLKLGGDSFKKQIQELRKQGLKTEPAFAKALQISEDPYNALLKLHKKSEADLKSLIKS